MDIASNIKRLRSERDWTQEQLAEKVGVTRPTITQWESGWSQPRMGKVEKLAEVFGVPKSEIIESRYEYAVINFASDDEKELIELYRAVPDAMKQAVVNMLRSYVEGSK